MLSPSLYEDLGIKPIGVFVFLPLGYTYLTNGTLVGLTLITHLEMAPELVAKVMRLHPGE